MITFFNSDIKIDLIIFWFSKIRLFSIKIILLAWFNRIWNIKFCIYLICWFSITTFINWYQIIQLFAFLLLFFLDFFHKTDFFMNIIISNLLNKSEKFLFRNFIILYWLLILFSMLKFIMLISFTNIIILLNHNFLMWELTVSFYFLLKSIFKIMWQIFLLILLTAIFMNIIKITLFLQKMRFISAMIILIIWFLSISFSFSI